ncbi:DUF4232 domain-containing protein [Verrucosispora sp. FIM060022]|uniref:DUF4232 domain-containing protein n=1 Tax=Verrucosispora sp. FIM060022 TaxID=1479020 RepID=UPI000F86818D|nr:DUF4232 domain-containing protein [Verrucosispora sp. FIM060022]RUL93871.1 DUF4232 domain-containing protein [Verrucosispora sp. FIM060022]
MCGTRRTTPATATKRRTRPYRRSVGALATLALLAGCALTPDAGDTTAGATDAPPPVATPSTGTPPTAGTTAPGPCPAEGVRINSLGVSAAMGLRAMGLELVNCGSRPYRLHGYPQLRLLDSDDNPIKVRVIAGARGITSGFDDPPRPLTLAPGEAAGAAVLWRNLVDDPTVVATNAQRLEVAPAEGEPTQEVAVEGPIDLGNTNRVGVSAWKKQPPTSALPPATPLAPTTVPPQH